MSGTTPPRPGDETTLRAGEYVLGLLDADGRAQIERAAAQDPALAAEIAAWEARLAPLAATPPEAPSAALWPRIAASIEALEATRGLAPAPAAQAAAQVHHLWRGISVLALAAAAGFAALWLGGRAPAPDANIAAQLPAPVARQAAPPPAPAQIAAAQPRQAAPAPPTPPHQAPAGLAAATPRVVVPQTHALPAAPPARAVAMLSAPGGVAARLRARLGPDGRLEVTSLAPISVPRGHHLGFWAWPAGHAAPVLLGSIAPGGGSLAYPFAAADGTPVMVTVEPDSGGGAKPGPTLFLGMLATTG